MKTYNSPELWNELYLDTPLASPQNPKTAEEAMEQPGCFVKSKEMGERGWPKHLGRVSKFNKDLDEVMVISSTGPATVWVMTVNEFFNIWRCD